MKDRCIAVDPTQLSTKMNALLQIFLFSAVFAVALCGVPRAEDVETVAAAARTVVKMHKLRKYALPKLREKKKLKSSFRFILI